MPFAVIVVVDGRKRFPTFVLFFLFPRSAEEAGAFSRKPFVPAKIGVVFLLLALETIRSAIPNLG